MNEYRCRYTPEPVLDINGTGYLWPVVDIELNGGEWLRLCKDDSVCPNGTYCRAPVNYSIPFNKSEIDLAYFNYGITGFDNIFRSILTIF